MSVKIKDIKTKMIKDDGSYSVTCSALGVYSSGKTKQSAKKNFLAALELHLSVLREKATETMPTAKNVEKNSTVAQTTFVLDCVRVIGELNCEKMYRQSSVLK